MRPPTGQYTAVLFGERCARAGITPSTGSKGDCFDNACSESFHATLKKELIYRYTWATRAEARTSEPGDIAAAVGEQAAENDVPVSDADSDQAMAGRRVAIAVRLVELGFIASDRATPENPAVQVLSELLPPDAELGLCLTCHGFSSSAPYPFAETTGIFPNVGSFRMNPALGEVSPHGAPLLTAPRRELVVCTQVAVGWTASRVRSDRRDMVTLYSAQFRDIVGATVRHRRKGVVELWVEDGPELSFRVTPEAADALQAHVDQAAQSQ